MSNSRNHGRDAEGWIVRDDLDPGAPIGDEELAAIEAWLGQAIAAIMKEEGRGEMAEDNQRKPARSLYVRTGSR